MVLVEELVLCCLHTPSTFANGDIVIFPLVVHQPASPSIWLAVPYVGVVDDII